MNWKIYVLHTGNMTLYRDFMAYGRGKKGEKVETPVWQALITNGEKVLLFDTGFGDPELPLNKIWDLRRTKDQEMEVQLKRVGYGPNDIDFVIFSHLHVDHAGNSRMFKKKARFVVQEEELRYAYAPEELHATSYYRGDFDHELDWVTVRGDVEFMDGIDLLLTPGHTLYHQSVVVNTLEGKIILCGDACYQRANWDDLAFPGTTADPVESMRSIKRLKRIRSGIPLFSHDLEFLEKQMKRVYG